MSRPRGLFVRRDTQAALWPRRETPTAVFSSAPPTNTSRLSACSRRRKDGGLSRTMASPKVITSNGMLCSASNLLHDGRVLLGQLANAVEIAPGDGIGLDQLAADPQA